MELFQGRLAEVEQVLGISFRNQLLLLRALTHSSYVSEHPQHPTGDYEQLEFLGDAILQLQVTEYLIDRFPLASEGHLTDCRSALVKNATLAVISDELNLHLYVLFGNAQLKEFQADQEMSWRLKACLLEAIIAAIYFDQGSEVTRTWIKTFLLSRSDEILSYYVAPCEILRLTILKRFGVEPRYKVKPLSEGSERAGVQATYTIGSLQLATVVEEDIRRAKSTAALRSLEIIKDWGSDCRTEILEVAGINSRGSRRKKA
ncbi:ribonuclease III family protein [Patescibacteria group bacterium]|nr:ribonuclease III family protein [Patescibacteria group bacterium]